MTKRFKVSEIHICPVYKVGEEFKPDLEYPTRFCVIDEEKEIAIDIKTKLKYDYIKTINHAYFVDESYKKIKENNRVAIFPYALVFSVDYDIDASKKIIEQLKNNEEFIDGNEVYNNKQYLEEIKKEKTEKSKKK